jgi:ribonuclease HI
VLPDETCGEAEGATKGGAGRGGNGRSLKSQPFEAPTAPPENGWIVYADGACSGNPGPCGLGVVIRGPEGATGEGYEYLGTGTNNIAELTAILRALEWIPPGPEMIAVYTDSSYAIGVLQKGWKAKANKELIEDVKAAMKKRANLRLNYVPGHAGVSLNELADELARLAVETRSSRPASFKASRREAETR